MRRLPPRPDLSTQSQKRLETATTAIKNASDPKQEAERLYTNARQTKWFTKITTTLATISGPGERCMFCSGSEASQVEHFRPKAVFPNEAMTWTNFLWVCGICNQHKSDHFPPATEPGGRFIDPTIENPWDFFEFDQFGNLCARWNDALDDLDPRADTMIQLLKLDRDALQQTRQDRLEALKESALDTLALLKKGEIDTNELHRRCHKWKNSSLQPDIADYFLAGPGQKEEPFRTLCQGGGHN